MDTEEQRKAYNEIITYLDHAKLQLPPELSEYLEETFTFNEEHHVVQLENSTNQAMAEMLNNTEDYVTMNG